MINNLNYVGGLNNIRHARYGNEKTRPLTKHEMSGGFQAPEPLKMVEGGKKKQKKFKTTAKGAEVVSHVMNVVNDMSDTTGTGMKNPKAVESDIKKEKAKFASLLRRGGTLIKKTAVKNGSTLKMALEDRKKFIDSMKEGLKRVIRQHTLVAVREFNNRIV